MRIMVRYLPDSTAMSRNSAGTGTASAPPARPPILKDRICVRSASCTAASGIPPPETVGHAAALSAESGLGCRGFQVSGVAMIIDLEEIWLPH
jgi:hypothetical protein